MRGLWCCWDCGWMALQLDILHSNKGNNASVFSRPCNGTSLSLSLNAISVQLKQPPSWIYRTALIMNTCFDFHLNVLRRL